MNNILIIAAHPDDEWIGCGGSILKHLKDGDKVKTIFLSDGYSSRNVKDKSRNESAISLMKEIGAEKPIFFDFPDNRLDSVDLLDVIQKIESVNKHFDPDIIYPHYQNDLNIDHRIAFQATITAYRPMPGKKKPTIYQFEVLSSSELAVNNGFNPNTFCDIEAFFEMKISFLKKYYDDEMRDFPHSRSYETISSLAAFRGSSVGIKSAEAFKLLREVK